jgi:hypothetical protein
MLLVVFINSNEKNDPIDNFGFVGGQFIKQS